MKEAIEPLQKALALDQRARRPGICWASLGQHDGIKTVQSDHSRYAAGNDRSVSEAIDLDPNGPIGAQAKQGLEQLQAMGVASPRKSERLRRLRRRVKIITLNFTLHHFPGCGRARMLANVFGEMLLFFFLNFPTRSTLHWKIFRLKNSRQLRLEVSERSRNFVRRNAHEKARKDTGSRMAANVRSALRTATILSSMRVLKGPHAFLPGSR